MNKDEIRVRHNKIMKDLRAWRKQVKEEYCEVFGVDETEQPPEGVVDDEWVDVRRATTEAHLNPRSGE